MRKFLKKWLGRSKSLEKDFEILLDGNDSALNVLIFTEYINATYFISFDIPLRLLHSSGQINFAVVSQKHVSSNGEDCWEHWADSFRPDIVFMTRYGESSGLKILESFRCRGVPVIYHIDDDLLEVPVSLGAEIQQRQGATSVVDTRKHLLRNCDLIYASTSFLAESMQKRFPEQRIFHGIYAPYMGDLLQTIKPKVRTNYVIGYMGSKGHQHDLELVVPALERLLDERKDIEFEVFGTIKIPHKLLRFGQRVRSYSVQKSYNEFLSTLSELNWDIGLAPLVDAPFNRCKAPTKYIEYTACGIFVLASNVSVYANVMPEKGGILISQDWYSPILELLADSQRRRNAVITSQRHCATKYSVQTLQQQLINIFDSTLELEKP